MISKDMLKRCQNEKMQAFCAFDKDVQNAILENDKHVECLDHDGQWYQRSFTSNYGLVWRLSPDTPTEPEYEERDVVTNRFCEVDCSFVESRSDFRALSWAVCAHNFIGIIYLKDGTETLRTSVDAVFGVPVRVRFSK